MNKLIHSDYFWKKKWPQLLQAADLELSMPSGYTKNETFMACSQRLYRVCHRKGKGLDSLPPRCGTCGLKSCSIKCAAIQSHKLALDIGSKTTWLMTSGFFLERHPSLLVIPLTDSLQGPSDTDLCETLGKKCAVREPVINHSVRSVVNCLLCHESNGPFNKPAEPQSTSVLGNYDFAASLAKMLRPPSEQQDLELIKSPVVNPSNPLMQNKFKLWSEISFMLRDANIDHMLLHPAQCFSGLEEFAYLEKYIHHLMQKFNMVNEIKAAHSTLVFCEPFDCSMELRKKISKFLIERLQATKVCFLNKGLAASMLFQVDTGIVIDSGARNTVVTVIINGRVRPSRTQSAAVGGTEIAQRLADSLQVDGLKTDVYLPSLDSSRVKSRCYLSLNPQPDQNRGSTAKRRVFVRCKRTGAGPHLEEIELGSELFLAPESMYQAMDLPNKLVEALKGLDPDCITELLSHILLTGSNTELKGFSTRLTKDLKSTFPKFRHTIFMRANGGSHSWDTVTGAMHVPMLYDLNSNKDLPLHVPGSYMWVTREDYILRGPELFETN